MEAVRPVKCTVIIPTRLRAALLSETLDSLANQTGLDFEVIVVCDGADPKTQALAESYTTKFPLTWIFTAENNGQASARNTGAQAAQGELLLFLDDDTVAAPDWVSQHRKHHDAHGSGIVVFGKLFETFSRPPHSHTERFFREDRERSLINFEANLTQTEVGADLFICCGLNCSIARATFLQSSGFDPTLRDIDEDMELGHRLYHRGEQFVFEPRAIVYHRSTKDMKEYHIQGYASAGRAHVHRVYSKQQRSAQTQALARLHHGSMVRRLKERIAWNHPDLVREVAELCYKATEVIGSKFFFRLWRGLISSVEYWEEVKSQGLTPDSLRQIVGTPLPILAFHSISAPVRKNEKEYYLSPQRFSRYMHWLRIAEYKCITLAEYLSGATSTCGIMLTFDDGYDDFYTEVFPLLDRFSLKPIVFIVVDRIGQANVWDEIIGYRSRNLLSVEQIREMHRYGVQFGSHTLTHPWLPGLSERDLQREVMDSKSCLEDLLGSEVTCFSYPSGGVDKRVRAAVAQAGYRIGMTTQTGLNIWQDPLCLNRIEVNETDTVIGLALKLAIGRDIKHDLLEQVRQMLRAGLNSLPDPLSDIVVQKVRQVRNRD